jgi:hypothetical protein
LLFTGGVIADFLIERLPSPGLALGSKAAVVIARQVSAIHERMVPRFKSAFAGCRHCTAHAEVGSGPQAAYRAAKKDWASGPDLPDCDRVSIQPWEIADATVGAVSALEHGGW